MFSLRNFVWNRLKDHTWHDGWPNSPQTNLLFHDFVIKFTQMKKGSGQKNAGSFLKAFSAIFSSCNTEGEFLVAPKNYQQLNEPLPGVFPGSAIFRNNSGTSILKRMQRCFGDMHWFDVLSPATFNFFNYRPTVVSHDKQTRPAYVGNLEAFERFVKRSTRNVKTGAFFFKFPVGKKNVFRTASIGGFGDLGTWNLRSIPRNGKSLRESFSGGIHEFSALFRDRFISHTKQFRE